MDDIVSELTAQALSQITEGHDIGNDSLIEDFTPRFIPIDVGNVALEEGVPTAADDSREGVTLSPEEEAMLEAALVEEHHEIPVNSATITVDETTSRFSGAIWYEQIRKQIVTLAGVGGIGRFGNLISF